jgi:hypothetical protein
MEALSSMPYGLVGPALCAVAAACPPAGDEGQIYCVSTSGSDADAGTASSPWRTLAHALEELDGGDTLLVRGGVYFERDLRIATSGGPAAPIRIEAHPGEQPVLDGGFREFRAPGNGDWELFDAEKGIHRSRRRFPGARAVGGYFGPEDRGWRLVPYEERTTLASEEQDYDDRWPFYYVGPGAIWDAEDERIYLRLEPGKLQERVGTRVPSSPDPAAAGLFLFPDGPLLSIEPGVGHVELRGLTLRYAETAIEIGAGAHHVLVEGCELRAGRYAVLVRDGAGDLRFRDLEVQGGFPDYVARSDVKEPTRGRPAHLLQGSGIEFEGRVERAEVTGSTFERLFDAIGAAGDPRDLRIAGNRFRTIRDDVLQLSSRGYRIEFAHNRLERVAAGVSWAGNGAPPAAQRGTKYVHHNVIDASEPMLYGRSDPRGLLPKKLQGPRGDGFASGRAFGMHGEERIDGPDPWKVYHNTVVVTRDVDNRGAGQCYHLEPFDAERPHEVYNNLFVQTAAHWVARGARVSDGSQVFDGNLYHRAQPAADVPLFLELEDRGSSGDFGSLAAFRTSSHAASSRARYGPGWEASGCEGDPRLDPFYVPSAEGPAASGAVDLSGKGWPGCAGERFRGALDPLDNRPPEVDAGADQVVGRAEPARLGGRCRDDGRPPGSGAVALEWTLEGGPAPVRFADPAAAKTTASFTAPGRYVLELSADDGAAVARDRVVLEVR